MNHDAQILESLREIAALLAQIHESIAPAAQQADSAPRWDSVARDLKPAEDAKSTRPRGLRDELKQIGAPYYSEWCGVLNAVTAVDKSLPLGAHSSQHNGEKISLFKQMPPWLSELGDRSITLACASDLPAGMWAAVLRRRQVISADFREYIEAPVAALSGATGVSPSIRATADMLISDYTPAEGAKRRTSRRGLEWQVSCVEAGWGMYCADVGLTMTGGAR